MKRHWPVGAEVSEAAFEGGRMLYDTHRTSNFSADFFEPEYWRKHDAIEGTARGRGTTWFIRAGEGQLRTAALPPRRADGKNFKGSLLVARRERDTRVRRVVSSPITCIARACRCPRRSPPATCARALFYRADLITQRIENSESLARGCSRGRCPLTQWIAVGRCIRRFTTPASATPTSTRTTSC